MKPRIKLGFCDFYRGWNPQDNYFTRLLAPHYELEFSDQPDFLIYSCFGTEHRRHRCTRIFFTGENVRPDFEVADFAFTFDYLGHPDHYRLPLYAFYFEPQQLVKTDLDAERVLAGKTGFCNFVYSNPRCKTRIRFFEQLSKYRQVDAGGKLLNNIGGPVSDKRAFVSKYKFTIAFENGSQPGYTTEKVAEPMLLNSLPIYWGNPLVHRDFNPRSFVNFYDYSSFEALIERVIELDRDDAQYCQMLRQPWYHDNRVNPYIEPAHVLSMFRRIFTADRLPRAQQPSWRKSLLLDRFFPKVRPYATVR